MSAQSTLKAVQEAMGMASSECDGIPGPQTAGVFAELCASARSEYMTHKAAAALHEQEVEPHSGDAWTVKASSFADPSDVRAFKRCKGNGGSDQECFRVGDNGKGFTGLDCTDESEPYVAVPPEVWGPKWGNASNASRRAILVTIKGTTIRCKIGDTMPHMANIHNGCGIDLAPGAQKAFGLAAPFIVPDVTLMWV